MKFKVCAGVRTDFSIFTLTPSEKRRWIIIEIDKGFMARFDSEASVINVREDKEAIISDVSYYHGQNLGKDSGGRGYSKG